MNRPGQPPQAGAGHAAEAHSPSGLLVVDKPLGRTSMDVCRVVRARLRAGGAAPAGGAKRIRVGHGGTLDPLATGVLVVLVGRATKLCDQVMAGAKRYRAEIDLAAFTPSDDAETPRQEVEVARLPTLEQVQAAVATFVGDIEQAPPAHSAVWVEGRRAYSLARTGEAPVLEPRRVRIDAIDILDYTFPLLTLDIRCGKGVYIRSLARDLGQRLHVGGTLTALRRTAVGPWTIEKARTLDQLPDPMTGADLLPVEA
jgi:tRNA pseudouridine55 synthase